MLREANAALRVADGVALDAHIDPEPRLDSEEGLADLPGLIRMPGGGQVGRQEAEVRRILGAFLSRLPSPSGPFVVLPGDVVADAEARVRIEGVRVERR